MLSAAAGASDASVGAVGGRGPMIRAFPFILNPKPYTLNREPYSLTPKR